ncbi:hypothetical protein K1719_003445 [Acacia pycnantha]|nr:hypothetical protein K1719_003445 [Acacia pycnantha]
MIRYWLVANFSEESYRFWIYSTLSKLTLWSSFFLIFVLFFVFLSCTTSPAAAPNRRALGDSWGGSDWEKRVSKSASRSTASGFTVLVTDAAGFVGTHVSPALKRRGDGVLGLDNFNRYYDPNLKRAARSFLIAPASSSSREILMIRCFFTSFSML